MTGYISPRTGLSYLAAAQAQKHVTVNETIRRLDAIVQAAVISASLASEPATPAEGDAYILPAGATGTAWASMSTGSIAAFQDGTFAEIEPWVGFVAFIADVGALHVFDGMTWQPVESGAVDSLPKLGVNTAADATNRLAVKSDALLFSYDDVTPGSGDMRQKLNKAVAGNTVSQLYQTNWSGRAETGLTGDDDYHVKVSPDGSTWREAIRVDRSTGRVSFPSGGAREVITANRTYYVRTDGSDANIGLADTAGGAFRTIQKAIDTAYGALDVGAFTVTIQVRAGTYAESVSVKARPLGNGSITLVGDQTVPANCVIQPGSAQDCLIVDNAGFVDIRGFQLTPGTNRNCLYVINGLARFRDIVFGAAGSGNHINILPAGNVYSEGNWSIVGGAARHVRIIKGYFEAWGRTITLTGAPNFANQFCYAESAGATLFGTCTFAGTATGTRYSAIANAVINTAGGGASYFPGSVAGSTATGGQYM